MNTVNLPCSGQPRIVSRKLMQSSSESALHWSTMNFQQQIDAVIKDN
jgi:hypothetical protein